MNFSFIQQNPKSIPKYIQNNTQEIYLIDLKEYIVIFVQKFAELKLKSTNKLDISCFILECLDIAIKKTPLFTEEESIDLKKNINLILNKQEMFLAVDELNNLKKFAALLCFVVNRKLNTINKIAI